MIKTHYAIIDTTGEHSEMRANEDADLCMFTLQQDSDHIHMTRAQVEELISVLSNMLDASS